MASVVAVSLSRLDSQLVAAGFVAEAPELPDRVWRCLASTIYDEVSDLDESVASRLRNSMPIPLEHYVEEMTAFQSWMDISRSNAGNPAIVRAQVMTELYVAFVWLRDSVMKPIAAVLDDQTAFATVEKFLRSGRRRAFRNAIAHGRWYYLPDYSGLEYWAASRSGQQHERFEITRADLEAWQLLSRGAAIAALLALTAADERRG